LSSEFSEPPHLPDAAKVLSRLAISTLGEIMLDILIVDDSAAIRKILQRVIRQAEIPIGAIYEAGDGLEALESLRKQPVGLILSDINMPNMNGLEFLSHVKADDNWKNLPVVMVSLDLRIRRFTPPAQKLLNLLPSDIGRRLGDIRTNLELPDLEALVHDAIRSAGEQEQEVREKNGAWYALRIRPYKSWDNKITGAVVSLQDINTLKRRLDKTREDTNEAIENSQGCFLLLDEELRVTAANRAFLRTFEVTGAEIEGRSIYGPGDGQWDLPELRRALEQTISQNEPVKDYEVKYSFAKLGPRIMLLNARSVELGGGSRSVVLTIEDVTDRQEQGVA